MYGHVKGMLYVGMIMNFARAVSVFVFHGK